MSEHVAASSYLDSRDREHASTLEGEAREVVVSTVTRYRREDRLHVGDLVPSLEVARLDDGSPVNLPDLVAPGPLVLVFGSFT